MLRLRRRPDRGALGRPFVDAVLDGRELEDELWEQPDEVLLSALFAALEAATPTQDVVWDRTIRAGDLASQLARRKLPYTDRDVAELFRLAMTAKRSYLRGDRLPIAVAAAEYHGTAGVEPELREAWAWVAQEQGGMYASERTQLARRIRKLLEQEPPREIDPSLFGGDDFGRRARRVLAKRANDPALAQFVAHAATATQSRASAKWRERAVELVTEADAEDEIRVLFETALASKVGRDRWGIPQWVDDQGATFLRGLLVTAAELRCAWLPGLAAKLAEMPSQKVANACFRALGEVGGEDAVAVLTALRARTRDRGVLKQIEAALEAAATAAGLTKGQLLERQVPTFGLDANGRREVEIGGVVATIVHGEVTWPDTKSAPARVRDEHPEELKALRAEAREIKKRLAVERVRVESLFAEARRWPAEEWRLYYRDHPLVSAIARRLLWRFLADDRSEVALGRDAPSWAETVELWHPIGVDAAEVRHWRRFLLEHELTQPFKQAFREVYELAPAERETGTYSNRFAAHIVRYPQLYGLVKQRGWGVRALGPYDNDGGRQWRDFEHFGIRAHFWLDHTGDEPGDLLDEYAATDQVRFTRIGDEDPLPLVDVPRLVFSEAMRDVDLFVGVTSIAGDPTWADRGEERYVDYWHAESFGALGQTAQMRRELLAELLPQLAIADRCELTDRYLVVRGDLRTYKIHLGSGNILMEPNDQFLCIVPARKRVPSLYLPFPDDDRLALILSKAFLLARDSKIRDRTIRAQIR